MAQSGEEEIIIIGGGGGKKGNGKVQTSLKPQGFQSIKTVAKQYSTWALAVILAAPELYQMAAMAGMLHDAAMPQHLMWAIRAVAGVGLVAKFIKQQKPE